MQKTVLHIHQDYPDGAFKYPFTKAVYNLVKAANNYSEDYRHLVVSINRTSNPLKVRFKRFEDGYAFIYWGIPFQYLHLVTLWLSSVVIFFLIKRENISIVHSHKLTTEAVVGSILAGYKKVPHVISIRGGSDTGNLKRFPMLKFFYRKIYLNACHVFYVSPWAKDIIAAKLNIFIEKVNKFPNICEIDTNLMTNRLPAKTIFPKFTTVVNYNQYQRKGIVQLIEAVKLLQSKGVTVYLDVFGYGELSKLKALQDLAETLNVSSLVNFKGQIDQSDLRKEMMKSNGMLLPSINETFGMSYIEALSVGCPIMYMANTGIDGFFDDYNIGVRVKSQDVNELGLGIQLMLELQHDFELNITKMNTDRYLENFTAGTLVKSYLSSLERFC